MAGDDLEVRQYQSGDSVFQQGDMGNEAYIVEKGIIENFPGIRSRVRRHAQYHQTRQNVR